MHYSVWWMAAGFLILVGEMLSMSFFLLFIAIGCFAAALLGLLDQSLTDQVVVCAVVSVLGMLALRKPIQRRLLKGIQIRADVGKEITIDQPMAAFGQTRISYQGTQWLATNLGPQEVHLGDRVIIVGIDGNVLLIRKVE